MKKIHTHLFVFLCLTIFVFSSCGKKKNDPCIMGMSIDTSNFNFISIRLVASAYDGLPPYTYHWSNGETDDTLVGNRYDTFTVTVTDNAGCTDSLTHHATTCPPTFTDNDNNHYTILRIGTQCWLKENYACKSFANGDPIPEVENNAAWAAIYNNETHAPAWCYYSSNQSYAPTYGLLYNWFAVNDPRGIAPEGWHVATKEDYYQLFATLGSDTGTIGSFLKSTTLWNPPNTGATDDYGFSGLPGGIRWLDGHFSELTLQGFYWSGSQSSADDAYYFNLWFNKASVIPDACHKEYGYSVRLVHD